ncbi:MAG: aldehyde reductase [Rhodospirillales bacterium]|nr:aldehyde reductase [Rhodospirillales bacterium]
MAEKPLVVVSGASGYIALHVIKQLLEQGYPVRGTMRTMSRTTSIQTALAKHVDVGALSFVETDLLSDKGWEDAMLGAEYLIHVASPVPAHAPKNENDVIVPARDGALRALKAAHKAGVKRVVLTSSVAAIYAGRNESRPYTEEDWSDLTKPIDGYSAYAKSKTLAEQAAWDFANENQLELSVINPSMVLGPLIDPDGSASIEIIKRVVEGKLPGWPRLGFSFVDVRDVAEAHIKAMVTPDAAGKRYICSHEYLWLAEIAKILKPHLAPKGRKIKTWQMPDWLIKGIANFDKTVRMVVSGLGKKNVMDSSRIRNELDWNPRDINQTICETADSLIEHKVV